MRGPYSGADKEHSMGSLFGRRGNLAVIAIAGALFFGALGFFLATGIDRPTSSRAENLWTEGAGMTPELRNIPSFAPIAERMKPTVVFILVKMKPGADQTTATTLPSIIPDQPVPGPAGYHDYHRSRRSTRGPPRPPAGLSADSRGFRGRHHQGRLHPDEPPCHRPSRFGHGDLHRMAMSTRRASSGPMPGTTWRSSRSSPSSR